MPAAIRNGSPIQRDPLRPIMNAESPDTPALGSPTQASDLRHRIHTASPPFRGDLSQNPQDLDLRNMAQYFSEPGHAFIHCKYPSYAGTILEVVKLLCRDWTGFLSQQDRQGAIVCPGFHDGITDDYEEDLGWMYMPVPEYVNWYAMLHDINGWECTYVRPPYIYGFEKEDGLPGAWGKG